MKKRQKPDISVGKLYTSPCASFLAGRKANGGKDLGYRHIYCFFV